MPKRRTDTGIRCPLCRSFDNRVGRTTPSDGFIVRELRCVNCGEEMKTREQLMGAIPVDPLEAIAAIYGDVLGLSIGCLIENAIREKRQSVQGPEITKH